MLLLVFFFKKDIKLHVVLPASVCIIAKIYDVLLSKVKAEHCYGLHPQKQEEQTL